MFAGLVKVLGPQEPKILKDQLVSRGIGPYRLFKLSEGPIVAYDGNGDGSQFVVIVPKAGLVAVRQIDAENDQENEGEGFEDFFVRVIALAVASGRLETPKP